MFWQVSIDHNMDGYIKGVPGSLCQPIIWSMATMLRESVAGVHKAWFPCNHPDRLSRLKIHHMETLPRQSQTTHTTEASSSTSIELSSIRMIGTIE